MKDACNLFLYCLKFVFIFPIDQELARLASRADKAQADFAAGRLEDRDLLIIVVAIAALVLLIVAVR